MKKAIITGATDGIGKEIAKELARRNYDLIIHGRNKEKAEKLIVELNKINNKLNYSIEIADFESQLEIYEMANRIKSRHDKIDVLINNAGIYKESLEFSREGIEKTIAVNYHAHFILTGLLLNLIEVGEYSRIINVSSISHSSKIALEDVWYPDNYDGMKAYTDSKLSMILFTFKLADLYKDKILVNCLDPGVIDTKLLRKGWSLGGSPVERGRETPVYLADSNEVEAETGNYYINKKKSKPAGIAYDKELQQVIWDKSFEMIKYEEIKNDMFK